MESCQLFSVLMYHEVSTFSSNLGGSNYMTPIYNISDACFEEHLKRIIKENLKTSLIEDIHLVTEKDNNLVFLTFDDGCIGNYTRALPLLSKYAQKATFFITTNLIGTRNYMSWDQVRQLVGKGMSVQSHSMNHLHLHELGEQDVMIELVESKKMIEDNISKNITAISFPHGSYNKQTIEYAQRAGYKVICTSDVKFNTTNFLTDSPVVLGRVAVTTNMTIDNFTSIIKNRKSAIRMEQMKKGSKNFLKHLIGLKNYGRLYRMFFNIKK